MAYLHNYYCNYHSGPVPALILEFGFFWPILNMRLAYFGTEDLVTLHKSAHSMSASVNVTTTTFIPRW